MIYLKIRWRRICRITLAGLLINVLTVSYGQIGDSLSIEECYALSRENYPMIRQKELIAKTREYSIENIGKGYLPQLSFNGQATYQSDVTTLPIKIPNTDIEPLSKDQYKIYGEITQSVYDGGILRYQQEIQEANAVIEDQKVEVELYKLKERINQLFFGILLIDEQLIQVALIRKDIESGIRKTEAAIANGIAFKSSADVLKAELLKLDQRAIELKANRGALVTMLSLFINTPLDENSALIKPVYKNISTEISRPELTLFEYQKKSFDIHSKMITSKNLPKVGLFLQAGYGRPVLNFLNNNFDTYYIGGIRFSWSLSGLYTSSKEKQILEFNQSAVDIQKETFLFNTRLQSRQQNSEIDKLQELIKTDEQLIDLRSKIKSTAYAQLENGVITSNDYLREVNAEDQARQNLTFHRLQLLLAGYNHETIMGN